MGSRPSGGDPADSNGCAAQVAAPDRPGYRSSGSWRAAWALVVAADHDRGSCTAANVDLLRRSWCRPWQPRSTRSSTSPRRIGGCVGSWSCRAASRQTWSRPRTVSCLTQDRSAVAQVQARV